MAAEGGYLLDASALLALLNDEPGADRVLEVLGHSSVHSVQLAEVVKKLRDAGVDEETAIGMIDELGLPVIQELSLRQAYLTGRYRTKGLSLGDGICLAVASWFTLVAVTADRRWDQPAGVNADWNVQVMQIR